MAGKKRFRIVRAFLYPLVFAIAALGLICLVLFLFFFHKALWHRFVTFPQQARAIVRIAETRRPVEARGKYTEFRGALHTHSLYSHDSEVTFEEILAAAKLAGIDFIFRADHCVDGKADYSLGWRGIHDGILFVPGFEMSEGFMPWGLPADTVLDCGGDYGLLAKEIADKNGVLFFAHSEEERMWDLPQLTGMEIYNIHTDFLDEDLMGLAPDLIISLRAYPDQVIRLLFDPQTDILAHWDALNATRDITGIAANDSHQNSGVRGFYTEDGAILLRDTGPDKGRGRRIELNVLTRFLARRIFGELEPGRQLFRVDLDPYERSLRYVNTHLLATELTETALVDALRDGRAFIAFDMLCDARGFSFTAESGSTRVVMGESVPLRGVKLTARSPVPCMFKLVRDGQILTHVQGREFTYNAKIPGKYRIEAHLYLVNTWVPWVYTNPIEVGTS